jgi:hypothetical protein
MAGVRTAVSLRIVKWLRLLGIAALAGVVATGVVVVRSRRAWTDYDSDEIRRRLHERYDGLAPSVDAPVA